MCYQGVSALSDQRTTLSDAWLVLHPEPEPRSEDAAVKRDALTFPSDNPVKRIDFVLLGTPRGQHGDVCAADAADSGTTAALAVHVPYCEAVCISLVV